MATNDFDVDATLNLHKKEKEEKKCQSIVS